MDQFPLERRPSFAELLKKKPEMPRHELARDVDALRPVTRESEAGGPSVTENERLGRPRGFNADR